VVKKDKNDMVMAIDVEALRVKESWNRVLVLVNPSLNTCRIEDSGRLFIPSLG